ncbi:MAG TPA: CBS domain-containing protein [Candidatus Methanoperedenaceae archaeon]|nr:CBS domain-containing protein [Candidatus Methanoperedenaceae archaeon]
MKTSFQIGRIMGIPIRLHITFLLILPVFVLAFAGNPAPFFGDIQPAGLRYMLSTAAVLLLFAGILVHEVMHSYFAIRNGVKVQNITLLLLGGVSSMSEIPRNPSVEWKMAFVGPATSLVIGGALVFAYEMVVPGFNAGDPYLRLLWLTGTINLMLGIFNLIPAFPMDGGRILRAWLAGRMPYVQATHTAAYVGKMFAFTMGIAGLLIPNIWLILIAFFIYIGASEEEKGTEIAFTLEGVSVRDIMSEDVVSVPPDMSIAGLVDLMFEEKHMGYPVVERGSLIGIVTFSDVRNIPREKRGEVRVSDVMSPRVLSVSPGDRAVDVLKLLNSNGIGRTIVIQDGRVVGIVSRTDLVRSIQLLS